MDEVEVGFHKDTYDCYIKPVDIDSPGFADRLLADFKVYKQTFGAYLPNYFGRDAYYHQPPQVANCLQHIHLCIPPRKFKVNRLQSDRVCKIGVPGHDVALVYAQNMYDVHKYVIIGVLTPDAHKSARNNELMMRLGGIARAYKNRFLD